MQELPQPLVSTDWLANHLGQPGLIVLDASRHLPVTKRDAAAEFRQAHIPGALFFDLASLIDHQSDVPQAMPRPDQLAERWAELGIGKNDRVVVYDDSAVKTSARAWFLFKAHGFETVAILDGGLDKWRKDGRPITADEAAPNRAEPLQLGDPLSVRFKQEIQAALGTGSQQLLDARSADRVFGEGIDPVHGGMNGRIPGSCNLPFGQVYNQDGTFKSPAELRRLIEHAGIDLSLPVVTTCGSGVTACVLLVALHLAGHRESALYDGSWVDWSSDPDTPKEQGPA